LASLAAVAAIFVAGSPVASAQENPVLDLESVQPVIPYSIAQQLATVGDRLPSVGPGPDHPWVPHSAPFPLNVTYVTGSYRNANGSTTIVYCALDVAAEHPYWYQENLIRTSAVGGARCNVRLAEEAGGGMTGTVRARSFPSGSQLASASLGSQHQVPEGQGSGWQAYGVATFDRASMNSNQQVQLEATLVLPAWSGTTNIGWNTFGPGCTRGSNNREVDCQFSSPPFQNLPYPCPDSPFQGGKLGFQPGACYDQPTACDIAGGRYGIEPNCVTLPQAPRNTSPPTVTGTARQGHMLRANPGAWAGNDPKSFAYQWRRCNAAGAACEDVPLEVQQTMKLSAADVGHTMRVAVTAVNGLGSGGPVSSAPTAVVASGEPLLLSPPSISGSPRVADLLTANVGTWSSESGQISYDVEWEGCLSGDCEPLPFASDRTYRVPGFTAGVPLRLRVTATNEVGSTTVYSALTSAVAQISPSDPSARYQAELDAWYGDMSAAATAAQGSPATSPPAIPPDWGQPGSCTSSAASVGACFSRIRDWARGLKEWLEQHRILGSDANGLPQMPVFDYAPKQFSTDLTYAYAGAYNAVRESRANPAGTTTVALTFHRSLSATELSVLASQLGITTAWAMRGTFSDAENVITAGFNDSSGDPLAVQLETFYSDQELSMVDVLEGLNEDLLGAGTAEEQTGAQATINDALAYRTALGNRDPLVSALSADVALSAADPLLASDSLVKAVQLAPSLDASSGYVDGADSLGIDVEMIPALPEPIEDPVAVASTAKSSYMPGYWNGRVKPDGRARDDGLKRKNNYTGMRWKTRKSLDWYEGDPGKRGFEPQLETYRENPDSDPPRYSTNWGGKARRGCLETTREYCRGTWNSNMPEAYRDDLTSDSWEVFSVGTANGSKLQKGAGYWSYFLTDHGETNDGRAHESGQATHRPSSFKEWGYCRYRGGRTNSCLFAEDTTNVQNFQLGSTFHRTSWP
jgi:hypothetical protein